MQYVLHLWILLYEERWKFCCEAFDSCIWQGIISDMENVTLGTPYTKKHSIGIGSGHHNICKVLNPQYGMFVDL